MAMRIFRSMPYLPSALTRKRFGINKFLAYHENTRPSIPTAYAPDKRLKQQENMPEKIQSAPRYFFR